MRDRRQSTVARSPRHDSHHEQRLRHRRRRRVVRDDVIRAVGGDADNEPHDTEIDARGGFLLPGLIQTHVHLCQTLFRGHADDLPLLDWLRRRVWPMEAAHAPASLAVSARLAASELLLSGTTTVLTMETVHDTEAVLEALGDTGLRAVVGKCMMDVDSPELPRRLRESTRDSLQESHGLVARWSARPGLVRAAAPRFALSCRATCWRRSPHHVDGCADPLMHLSPPTGWRASPA